jgi:hypothetical protein
LWRSKESALICLLARGAFSNFQIPSAERETTWPTLTKKSILPLFTVGFF